MPRPSLTVDGFWAKVDKTEECWFWKGATYRQGYGIVHWRRRTMGAHRAAYEIAIGPIPDGMDVLHHCDNPSCVRPDHLFIGDHATNMRDRWLKGRYSGNIKGERVNTAKLNSEQVKELRRRYANGETQMQLAEAYNLRQSTVWAIIHRRNWKHVD